jgi:MFS family permease
MLSERLRALHDVAASPDLRRLELAWGSYYTAECAWLVALAVYAYDAGGPFAVGLVGFIRTLPMAVAVPLGSIFADRFPRQRVLFAVDALRGLALAGSAIAAFAAVPAAVVYALAALAAVVAAPYRPAQWAILPLLSRNPEELVAANAASSTVEGLAVLAGPGLAAALLAGAGPEVVFALSAALSLAAALLVGRIQRRASAATEGAAAPDTLLAATLAGFETVARDPHSRLLIALFGAQTLVRGALNVLIVVVALELLGLGDAGVGFLSAAIGVGGLAGALGALALVGRPRLAGPFALGLVLWGLPIALVAAWLHPLGAFLCLAVVGAGNSVLDVAGFTLVQRLVPDHILARVFGVLETIATAGAAFGALATPFLVDAVGGRAALVLTGAFLPVLAAFFRRRLDRVDAAARVLTYEVALLRGIPLFAPLSPPTLERLASALVPITTPAGADIVRERETGDRFYVIEEGDVAVSSHGKELGRLGQGECFGEIALLLDVPRTATVTALTPVRLRALPREAFLEAVTGHRESARAAAEALRARTGADPASKSL